VKKLILLIGIPGSGKTTLAKKLVDKNFKRICADEIRGELYGDQIVQGDSTQVFAIFFERLRAMFAENSDVVVDNTNLYFKHRKPILDIATEYGYTDIQLWMLDIPVEICLKRNINRERNVPDETITNYYNELNRSRPKRSEGKLVILRPNKDGTDLLFFAQS
jgi:predicted kinase